MIISSAVCRGTSSTGGMLMVFLLAVSWQEIVSLMSSHTKARRVCGTSSMLQRGV